MARNRITTPSMDSMMEFIKGLQRQLKRHGDKKIIARGFTVRKPPIDFLHSSLSAAAHPRDICSAEDLEYHNERGRKPNDVIIMLAIQMGIEQGYRMALNDNATMINIAERTLAREESEAPVMTPELRDMARLNLLELWKE